VLVIDHARRMLYELYRAFPIDGGAYWEADSGAVNDLDMFEVARWFESRGDTCLTCARGWRRYLQRGEALELRRGRRRAPR
jgi:hypothetical protein